jgi:hypothetical protein
MPPALEEIEELFYSLETIACHLEIKKLAAPDKGVLMGEVLLHPPQGECGRRRKVEAAGRINHSPAAHMWL